MVFEGSYKQKVFSDQKKKNNFLHECKQNYCSIHSFMRVHRINIPLYIFHCYPFLSSFKPWLWWYDWGLFSRSSRSFIFFSHSFPNLLQVSGSGVVFCSVSQTILSYFVPGFSRRQGFPFISSQFAFFNLKNGTIK